MVQQLFPTVYFFARLHISVLIDKTKICIFRTDDVSHVTFFSVQKITFFVSIFGVTIMLS